MPRCHVLPGRTLVEARSFPVSARIFLAGLLLAACGGLPARALDPSRPAVSSPPAGETLTYWIELLEAPVGPGPQVTERRIFHSGEKIRLHVRSRREGFVSLLQIRSSGPASELFPAQTKSLSDNRVRANEDRVLPTDSYWFSFDEKPGKEELLLLFGTTKEDLDRLRALAQQPGTREPLPGGALRIQLKHE